MGFGDFLGTVAGAGLGMGAGPIGAVYGANAGNSVAQGNGLPGIQQGLTLPGIGNPLGGLTTNYGANPYMIDNSNLNQYANPGAQAQTAAQQQAFANALQQQAAGTGGPSVANAQYQQAMQQNLANSQAQIASQRGINPGLALRQGMMAQAQGNQALAGQAMIGRQQEQLNAQGQLGNVLSGMRGQDLQNALGYQNLIQQGQLGNQGAVGQSNATNAGIATSNTGNTTHLIGGILGGVGAAGAAAAGRAQGGKIPGQAKVAGDSYENDTVPTMLSPGEIVVPRSHAEDPKKAKEFIDHLMKGKKDAPGEKSYGEVLAAHKKLQERVKKLEQKLKEK